MPRIRTLKPDALQHRKVGQLSDRAFRCWILMITQADDDGRLVAEASQLRVLGWGYHPKVTLAHVETALKEITSLGLVRRYAVNETWYAEIPSWKDHQRIKKPTPSKFPSFQESSGNSPPVPHQFPTSRELPPPGREGKGMEGSGEERSTPTEGVSGGDSWPENLRDVKHTLETLSVLDAFNDPAYWRKIEAWIEGTGYEIYWLDQLKAYVAHQAAQSPSRRHMNLKRGFRNWLATAVRWKERDAQRKAAAPH